MKKNIKLFCLLTTLLLVGCGQGNTNTTTNGVPEPSSPTSNGISTTTTSPISKDISKGGVLIDMGVGAYLATGEDHVFSFNFIEASNENPIVYTSDETILKYEFIDGKHVLHALKAGDAILYIKDNTGFTHYRDVAHVRDPIPENQIEDYLVSVDIWVGWGLGGTFTQTDYFTLTFLGDGLGIMQGVDAGINIGNIEFTYEYVEIAANKDYYFQVLDWKTSATTLNFVGFYVSRTGDLLYGQMPDGAGTTATFEIFAPESL